MKLELKISNNRKYIFLFGDKKIIRIIDSKLSKIPPFQLLPTFRGFPKPEKFIFYTDKKLAYVPFGLYREIELICKDNNIELINSIDNSLNPELSKEDLREKIESWNLNIVPRDYQVEACFNILKHRMSLSQLATRAGKTLMLYIISRWCLEEMNLKKILVIVPSTQLVKQGLKDLKEYGDFFKVSGICGGLKENEDSNIIIGTFQSLVKRDEEFFKDFDMVVVDECHKLPCKSIFNILNKLDDIKIQFGFSGTLPKENSIEWLASQSLMGPKIQEIKASDLIDEGFLAKPLIKQIRLNYSFKDIKDDFVQVSEYILSEKLDNNTPQRWPFIKDYKIPAIFEIIKTNKPKEYPSYLYRLIKERLQTLVLEQYLVQLQREKSTRFSIIEDLIKKHKNDNIILFGHNVEYLNYLDETLSKKYKTHLIVGRTSQKKRTQILKELDSSSGQILIAGYGVIGTGITLKNIQACIFTQSFKSEIINIQSIGRGLLKNKDNFFVYDIIDCFEGPDKIYKSKLDKQGLEKIKIYKSNNYDFEVIQKSNQKKLI